MRLYTDWQPTNLSELVGQPCTTRLKHFLAHPRNDALLLHGPSGTGKTSALEIIAATLGDEHGAFPTVYRTNGTKFCLELAERFFEEDSTPFRFASGPYWHLLLLEEVEWLHKQVINYMKDSLEKTLRHPTRKIIIVATSNDISAFKKNGSRAFLDRFKQYEFTADLTFATACFKRLAQVCAIEGIPQPDYSAAFDEADGSFSMRRAMDCIEDAKQNAEVPV